LDNITSLIIDIIAFFKIAFIITWY